MTLAAALALSSALGFAFSTSVQHVAASSVPVGVTNPLVLVWRLLRTPAWLAGSTIGLTAWGLHAAALHFGTLSLVQPIILLGVVLAVVVRAGFDRHLPKPRELAGVLVTIVSLILMVAVADRSVADSLTSWGALVLVVAVAWVLAITATVSVNRLPRRGVAAFSLGVTAGALFGVSACLMKVTGDAIATHGVLGAFTTPGPWLLLPTAFFAMTLNQRAYQLSRLSHSMPVLNVTSVLLSILLGALLFGESLPSSPTAVAVWAVGMVGIGFGLRLIALASDRHPADRASAAT